MAFVLVLLFSCCLIGLCVAQIPCDDVYMKHCPELSGWAVQECIRENGGYDGECADFMRLHDACIDEIVEYCRGFEYSGDLIPCLTQWTAPEKISERCRSEFPKKKEETPSNKKGTKEQRAKANKRRRTRMAAARQARKMMNENL